MNVNQTINEKRIFTASGGKKLNMTFVPALASYKYEAYAKASTTLEPKLRAEQRKLSDPEYKRTILSTQEGLDEFNATAKELRDEAEKVNKLGLEIITIILEENPQDFEVCEQNIFRRMSLADMNRFIMEACLPNFGDAEKKK